ncbi:AIR synthase related protein [Streptomyces umbrinus]|uniref:AIR synthase related protein n=1 Tax=Streptomyces umbrinus TaxID=67370 RepID=UPI003DCF2DA2
MKKRPCHGPAEDAALLPGHRELVTGTDSFVVSPLFLPGGDIRSLAVHGTVNDLAMRGARPLAVRLAHRRGSLRPRPCCTPSRAGPMGRRTAAGRYRQRPPRSRDWF